MTNPNPAAQANNVDYDRFVGTLVGESTSRMFRLAVAHETIREQDIIAVDVKFKPLKQGETPQEMRLWAKVQQIERLNPLFPMEAGHELAETRTNPFDTVLSLSREMVTAVCQVLGSEPIDGSKGGRLDHVRYPPQPASQAYTPTTEDLSRIVIGDLGEKNNRALDIATLSNRPKVDVKVDGHAIVTRHLAILAMTGAGKSVTARRIVEQLALKNYPIVIFDPHGDYTGLAELQNKIYRVQRYYAQFPVFEEESETVAKVIDTLGYELTPTMQGTFDEVFAAANSFYVQDPTELKQRQDWLVGLLGNENIVRFGGLKKDMWLIGYLSEAAERIIQLPDNDPNRQIHLLQLQNWGWPRLNGNGRNTGTLSGIKKRVFKAAAALTRMELTNKKVAGDAIPIPTQRTELVKYGQVSVVSLAGYTGNFQATIYSIIANSIFEARVRDELKLPVVLLLEEAHNFVPGKAMTTAEERSIAITKQIAQEGRKFGVGLIMISQRPSRLDETALSMCNSYIVMRMINPADQNFVRRVIESLGEDEAKMLPDLDVGEAILSGQFINFPVLVRVKQPESQGEREEKEDAFKALEEAQKAIEQEKTKQNGNSRRP